MLNNNNICDIVEHNTYLYYTFKCTFLKYRIHVYKQVMTILPHIVLYRVLVYIDGRSNIGSYNVHVNMYICK